MLVFLAIIGCHASIRTAPSGAAAQPPLDAELVATALVNMALVDSMLAGDAHFIGFGRVEPGHQCGPFHSKFDGSSVSQLPGASCAVVVYDDLLAVCDGTQKVRYATVACSLESKGLKDGGGIQLLITATP